MSRAAKTTDTERSAEAPDRDIDIAAPEIDQITSGTTRTLAGLVQARLTVSQPSDPHEIEAETMAAEFVSTVHRRSGHVSHPARTALARRAAGDGLQSEGGSLTTTDEAARAIDAAGGGGRSLPGDVRSDFEGFFGADLGGVRIHADGQADNLCRSIEAEAFTKGNDVYFASGQYAPGTAGGDHLLAHELTHVVQQGAPAISRVWSFDPRKWGKSKEEVEKDEKAAFEKKMDAKAAKGRKGQVLTQEADAAEGGRLLDNAENLDNLANDLGGGAGGTVGGSMTADKIAKGDVTSMGVDTTAKAEGADIATAAVSGTIGLGLAIKELVTLWGEGTFGENVERAVAVLEKALAATEGALKVAVAAGGAAAQALPGIGLAITLVDLAKRAVRIYYLQKAAKAAAEVKEGEAEGSDLSISLGTIGGLAERQRNLEIAQVVGDVVVVIGQIAMLSGVGSPWGAIVAVSGLLAKAGASFVGQVMRWVEAAKVQNARADTAAAEKQLKGATTDEEKAAAQAALTEAKKKQLAVDGWEAAREVLEKASTLDEKGKPVAKMVKLLDPFGIHEDWIVKFNAAGRPPAMFDDAATSIVRMIGTSKDPLTFVQTLKSIWAAVKNIWAKVVSVFTGGEDLDVGTPGPRIMSKTREDLTPIVTTTVMKQAKKGEIDGFKIADAVEDALRKPFGKLKNLFAPATAKGTKYEAQAKSNVVYITEAVAGILKSQTLPKGFTMDGYTEDGDVEASIRSAA